MVTTVFLVLIITRRTWSPSAVKTRVPSASGASLGSCWGLWFSRMLAAISSGGARLATASSSGHSRSCILSSIHSS